MSASSSSLPTAQWSETAGNCRLRCAFCPHYPHAAGTRCNQQRPRIDKEPCRCMGKQGFWRGALAGLGNAVGEFFFGGSR